MAPSLLNENLKMGGFIIIATVIMMINGIKCSLPVKQEVNSTVILPPLVFPGVTFNGNECDDGRVSDVGVADVGAVAEEAQLVVHHLGPLL